MCKEKKMLYKQYEEAIETGNTPLLEEVFKKGFSVNTFLNNGRTGFMQAIHNQHQNIIDIFFENNVDVNHGNGQDCPLKFAIIANDTDTAKKCIKRGADLKFIDKYGNNFLHWACDKENFELIKIFVQKNVSINYIRNDYHNNAIALSRTPLDVLLEKKNKKLKPIIAFLVQNGAKKAQKLLAKNPGIYTPPFCKTDGGFYGKNIILGLYGRKLYNKRVLNYISIIYVTMKKSLVLLIGILILSSCTMNKTGNTNSGTITPSISPSGNTDTGSLGENPTNWHTQSFGKYFVKKESPKDSVGENITITSDGKTIFTQNNNDTQTPGYFFNIVGDILIIDYGTGPSKREISLFNLTNSKKIMTTEYIAELSVVNNSLEFVTQGDNTISCDKEILKQSQETGLSITKVQKNTFDFSTQKITSVGKTYCTLTQ